VWLACTYVETVTNSYELSDQFVHQTGRHRFQVHASMRHIPILDLRNGTGWGSQATSTPLPRSGPLIGRCACRSASFLPPALG